MYDSCKCPLAIRSCSEWQSRTAQEVVKPHAQTVSVMKCKDALLLCAVMWVTSAKVAPKTLNAHCTKHPSTTHDALSRGGWGASLRLPHACIVLVAHVCMTNALRMAYPCLKAAAGCVGWNGQCVGDHALPALLVHEPSHQGLSDAKGVAGCCLNKLDCCAGWVGRNSQQRSDAALPERLVHAWQAVPTDRGLQDAV